MALTAQYRRWKYLIQKGYRVPPELDTVMLDKMENTDWLPKFPIEEIPKPGELHLDDCPNAGCDNKMELGYEIDRMHDNHAIQRGSSWCVIPPRCKEHTVQL